MEGSFKKVLDQEEIDMTNLQIGLYFLSIKGDKTTKSIKIIKQ